MKFVVAMLSLFFPVIVVTSQSPAEILNFAVEKCNSLKSGSYVMNESMKSLTSTDTTLRTYDCKFKKLSDDTIFHNAFQLQYFYNKAYVKSVLYTGNELALYSLKDSTGTILSTKIWSEEIQKIKYNYVAFEPFTQPNVFTFLDYDSYKEGRYELKFMGNEILNGYNCYHIKLIIDPTDYPNNHIKDLHIEYHIWLNQYDSIPVQYSSDFVSLLDGDTMRQYQNFALANYSVSETEGTTTFKLDSIPDYFKLEDYVQGEVKELLKNGTAAPNWILYDLDGNKTSLDEFKGSLILLDFFYKSCYPCLLSIPSLNAFHDKYGPKGLIIIGIDPFDKDLESLSKFLKNKNVQYRTFIGNKKVLDDYSITGFPTIYLINQKGKVVFSEAGFGPELIRELENLINDNL